MLEYQDILVDVVVNEIVAEVSEVTIDVEVTDTEVITAEIAEVTIAVDITDVFVIDAELGPDEIYVDVTSIGGGGTGSSGQIFITDVTGAGIVSGKLYVPDTVPANRVLTEASTDADSCTIYFIAEGGLNYSPLVTLNEIPCANLTEVAGDLRLFTGSFNVAVSVTTTYSLVSSAGGSAAVTLNRAAVGPAVLSCLIGALPGVQTTAKAGDSISVTGTVEPEATEVRLVAFGAFDATGWVACPGGVFTIPGIVSGATGLQNARVQARNAFGTLGGTFDSSNQITLDQTIPQFTFNSITYPIGQLAFKGVEAGSVDVTVSDYTSLLYSSPHGDFIVASTAVYEQNKAITCTNPGDYNDSSTNYSIVAQKASNGSTNTYNLTVEVADIAPSVVVTQPNARLRSSALGVDYTITATSNQNLSGAPVLTIPVSGTWQGGGFVGGAKVWTRTIRIADADTNGTGAWTFSSVPVNNAGLSASISGNEVVGGFVSRNIALPAFANNCNLGTQVAITAKLVLTWSFKAGMTFQPIGTPPPVVAGWTIDAIGINPTSIIILDTSATSASSVESTITIEEVV